MSTHEPQDIEHVGRQQLIDKRCLMECTSVGAIVFSTSSTLPVFIQMSLYSNDDEKNEDDVTRPGWKYGDDLHAA